MDFMWTQLCMSLHQNLQQSLQWILLWSQLELNLQWTFMKVRGRPIGLLVRGRPPLESSGLKSILIQADLCSIESTRIGLWKSTRLSFSKTTILVKQQFYLRLITDNHYKNFKISISVSWATWSLKLKEPASGNDGKIKTIHEKSKIILFSSSLSW